MLDKFYAGQVLITRGLVLALGWIFFLFAFVVTANVILRKVFSFSLQGVDEYGGYILAIAAAIGFSQAAIERIHIRIDILTARLSGPARSSALVLAIATLFCTMLYIFWNAYDVARTSYEMGAVATSVLRTPLWMPQGTWALAIGWGALVLFVQFAITLRLLLRGNWISVLDRFGPPSIEDEIRREVSDYHERSQHQTYNEVR